MKYKIILSVDWAQEVKSVDDMLRRMESFLTEYGVSDKLKCSSGIEAGTMNVDRQLTGDEKNKITQIMEKEFAKTDLFREHSGFSICLQ